MIRVLSNTPKDRVGFPVPSPGILVLSGTFTVRITTTLISMTHHT